MLNAGWGATESGEGKGPGPGPGRVCQTGLLLFHGRPLGSMPRTRRSTRPVTSPGSGAPVRTATTSSEMLVGDRFQTTSGTGGGPTPGARCGACVGRQEPAQSGFFGAFRLEGSVASWGGGTPVGLRGGAWLAASTRLWPAFELSISAASFRGWLARFWDWMSMPSPSKDKLPPSEDHLEPQTMHHLSRLGFAAWFVFYAG